MWHSGAWRESSPQHLQRSGKRGRSKLRRWIQLKPLAMVVATELAIDETARRRERKIAVTAPHQA
jgi:hypothetical protein